jgi:hypothetical protein
MLSTRSWACLYYDALKLFALMPELERKACAPADRRAGHHPADERFSR